MTYIRNRRLVAAIVAASCLSVPASAAAESLPSTYKSDAAQSGSATSLPSSDRSDAAQSGTDPGNAASAPYEPAGLNGANSAQSERTAATTFPPAEFRGGDTPVDHPGASRAPTAVPTTIEVDPLAQERYYSSYGTPDSSAAVAHERYLSSYGEPEPLTMPQSPVPSDGPPWLSIALSIAGALVIVASATRVRRLRVRRRRAVRSTA
jgi:hypothetical protein